MAVTWTNLRKELDISKEDESIIKLEKELIQTIVKLREEKGLTQVQVAEMCNIKQPTIARLESAVHSPRIDSILKVLSSLGYTLAIVPMAQNK